MSDGQWIERATLDLWEDRHREQLVFIKELATKLATCERHRDAYAEMDRIGTQAVRDLEAKLAKAVEALRFYAPQTVGGITFVGGDDAGKRAAAALVELEGKK